MADRWLGGALGLSGYSSARSITWGDIDWAVTALFWVVPAPGFCRGLGVLVQFFDPSGSREMMWLPVFPEPFAGRRVGAPVDRALVRRRPGGSGGCVAAAVVKRSAGIPRVHGEALVENGSLVADMVGRGGPHGVRAGLAFIVFEGVAAQGGWEPFKVCP